MDDSTTYVPPKIWQWKEDKESKFASINRPISGPTHDKELPVGKHPLQLYSLATPNGVKITVLLEELLAIGKEGAAFIGSGIAHPRLDRAKGCCGSERCSERCARGSGAVEANMSLTKRK